MDDVPGRAMQTSLRMTLQVAMEKNRRADRMMASQWILRAQYLPLYSHMFLERLSKD
jgi:hypothetical protein